MYTLETEFRYHLKFLQNHRFSFIPASFSVGLIEDNFAVNARYKLATVKGNKGLFAYNDVFGITPQEVTFQPQHLRLLSDVNVFGGLFLC